MSVCTTGVPAHSTHTTSPTVPGFRDDRVDEYFEADELEAEAGDEEFDTSMGITVSIRQVIGAGIVLGLGIVILNEVFSMDLVANSSGPFSIDTVSSPLGAALGILGLAIFVGGARIIMNQMGGGNDGRGGL